jgi:hypothetical protein
MKKLGRFCALVILTLSIALTSYAGHIDCGDTGEPPPPQATGEIECGLTAAVVNLLERALLLF